MILRCYKMTKVEIWYITRSAYETFAWPDTPCLMDIDTVQPVCRWQDRVSQWSSMHVPHSPVIHVHSKFTAGTVTSPTQQLPEIIADTLSAGDHSASVTCSVCHVHWSLACNLYWQSCIHSVNITSHAEALLRTTVTVSQPPCNAVIMIGVIWILVSRNTVLSNINYNVIVIDSDKILMLLSFWKT